MDKKKEMKSITKAIEAGCPEHEVLCAYFDGELDKGTPESVHIASCKLCQEKLDDFRKMGEAISKTFSNKAPADFPETMLKKVRTKISAEKNPVIPFYLFQLMKAAAIFLLITCVFIYVKNSSETRSSVVADETIHLSPPAQIVSTVPERTQDKPPIGYPSGQIQLRDMRDVSTSPDVRFLDLAQSGNLTEKPVAIPDMVTHVWTATNTDTAIAKARECLAKSGVSANSIRFSKAGDGMVSSEIRLDKKQLSSFVRLYAKDGFELLSPMQPQPEQNVFYGNADDPVGYELKIVSPEK